ncbi:MAG: choice-of-anchor A family protein, partial [Clostridiales bacterium]|nr:choice-of-anchor A family protein [Clostridiales bacterium]
MGKNLKRIATVLSAIMTLTFFSPLPSMQNLLADQTKDSDKLPILSGTYTDSGYYWDNLLGEAGNFSLFAFDSIYNDTHVNGNLACKNWYIGMNYTEPHTGFGNYESHPLVNIVTNKIDDTSKSVNFGNKTVHHPNNPDGKIWGLGMLDTILIPVSYDVKYIDPYPTFDQWGRPTWNTNPQNIKNNAPIKDNTYIYSNNSDLTNGALRVRATTNAKKKVFFAHTPSSYMDFDALKVKYQTLSAQLAKLNNNVSPSYDRYDVNKNAIWLNSNGTNVLNVSAKDFKPIMNINNINYTNSGYKGNQSLVINIDLSGVDRFEMPQGIKYKTVNGTLKDEEQMASKGTNIIYNFYNAKPGTTVIMHATIGHILAPDCTVIADGGSGTIIANNIYASNETHMSFIPKGLTIDLPNILNLEISKTSTVSSNELPGALLTLTGKDKYGKDIIINTSSVKFGEEASINTKYKGNGISFYSGKTKTLISNLPDGNYVLKEDAAPAGYDIATEIRFSVAQGQIYGDPNVITQSQGDEPGVVTMKDALLKREVIFSKSDASGKELFGATLVLTGKDIEGNAVNITSNQVTPGNQAYVLEYGTALKFLSGYSDTYIRDLPAGQYTLTEFTAPQGFLKAESINFEITKDMKLMVNGKEVDKISMIDEFATDVFISKQDIDSGEELVGARMTLSGTDKDKNPVDFSNI